MFSTKQANRANYATAGISLVFLLIRLIVGRWRRRPLDLAFFLILASTAAITARIVLNYYVLHLGTSSDAQRHPGYFETHTRDQVVKGSKLILGSRVALTTVLWLQVCLLLLFYSQIMNGIRWVRIMIRLTWTVMGLTYLAAVLSTFLECQPFHLYWQIDPNPGSCVKAYAQLLVQCISNIVLDLLLLAISFPILVHRGRTWIQNVRVGALFILGTFCMVVTGMRLTAVYSDRGQQAARTLWGAVQIIVATFVANAPTCYGDLQVIFRRKQEIKTRRSSRPESWTRSDHNDDLANDDQEPSKYGSISKKEENVEFSQFSEQVHRATTAANTIPDGSEIT